VEILIAQLAEIGFESFVETDNGVKAYIPDTLFAEDNLKQVGLLSQDSFKVSWEVNEIVQQNWNERWERSFEPIVVDEQCVVRAPFHSESHASFEIIIEPKMSFGTGHHETTYMMLQLLLGIDCSQMTVLDMGCGTAVLAILAEKKGAVKVDAIDIDNWCVENSIENCQRNDCSNIRVCQGDASLLTGTQKYDLILANINRNILLSDIKLYARSLKAGGTLLLSGFYTQDLEMISEACREAGGVYAEHLSRSNWIAAKFVF
jgi:ribosomal protein L11 methyltransferase